MRRFREMALTRESVIENWRLLKALKNGKHLQHRRISVTCGPGYKWTNPGSRLLRIGCAGYEWRIAPDSAERDLLMAVRERICRLERDDDCGCNEKLLIKAGKIVTRLEVALNERSEKLRAYE